MNDNDSSKRRLILKALGTTAILPLASGIAACSGDKPDTTAAPQPPADANPETTADMTAEDVMEDVADEIAEASEEVADEIAEEAADIEQAVEDQAAVAEDVQLAPLTEDDAQAKALAYVEDATTTDTSVQVRYEAGQACENCVLFMPQGDSGRGACSIFPGRSVNNAGWCSVYAPKG